MTFPAIPNTASGADGSSGTSHTFTLPTGRSVGDRVLFVAVGTNNVAGSYTWPGGWNEIFDDSSGASVNLSAAYRDCDGTEGATISATTSNSQTCIWVAYLIRGHRAGQAPASAVGSSGSVDPPSITPSWGVDDDLVIAACAGRHTSVPDPSAYPANYGLSQLVQVGDGAAEKLAICARQIHATTEDPGAFTWASLTESKPATIAIRGGGSAAGSMMELLLGMGR